MSKTAIFLAVFVGIFTFCFNINTQAQATDIEAVKIPLENYLTGHKTGDAEYMKKAMHTEGKLFYFREGKYATIDFPTYIGGMKIGTANDEDQRKRYIESITVTGDVAVGKLVLDYPTIKFTDYMTLLKINGEWKIVNKIAYSVRDPQKNKAERAEIGAIKVPLENYLMSDKTDNPEFAKKAFHTEGKLIWMSKGKFSTLDFKDFIAGMDGKPSGTESEKSRWIESIDATGNIAVAKVVLDSPKSRVYDFFSLMKIDGEWKIVNKSFTFERKPAAQ